MSAEYANFNSNEILIPFKTQNFIAVKLQQNKISKKVVWKHFSFVSIIRISDCNICNFQHVN